MFSVAAPLLAHIDAIAGAKVEMVKEAELIFDYFRDGRPDRVAQETPFSEIVKEKESPLPPQTTIAIPLHTAV